MGGSAGITVEAVADARARKAFVRFPYELYRGDAAWRPPVRLERAMQIDPKHNKMMSDIDATLFLARRNGEVVGRIAAFTNAAHMRVHDAEEGFFGFFDCGDDAEVADALLSAAEGELRRRGMARVLGPAQWSTNEEVGLLVDGFEHPNVLLMPYGRPYYRELLERRGYQARQEMLAFQADLAKGHPRPPAIRRLLDVAEKNTRVSLRKLDKKNFAADVELALGIYNDAWSENWAALPYTPAQVKGLANELKPLIDEELFVFAEVDGEAVAFGLILPDLLQAVRELDGHVLRPGILRALWRWKTGRITQARLPLMGMKRSHQKTRHGLIAMTWMCEELFRGAERKGFTHIEASWVLESNTSLIGILEGVEAEPYKRYRMYGREL